MGELRILKAEAKLFVLNFLVICSSRVFPNVHNAVLEMCAWLEIIFLIEKIIFRLFKTISDADRSIPQILKHRGFDCEVHHITCKDGTELETWRLTNHNITEKDRISIPIVLMHGLAADGSYWIVNGSSHASDWRNSNKVDNSLAVTLSNHGRDVWVTNYRGTVYDTTQNYTGNFDDLASNDFFAIVNYINGVTRQTQLDYVGFSQGGTMALAAMSESEELAKKIRHYIGVANPFRFSHGITGLTVEQSKRVAPFAIRFLSMFGHGLVIPRCMLKLLIYLMTGSFYSKFLSKHVFLRGMTDLNYTNYESLITHIGLQMTRHNVIQFFQTQLTSDKVLRKFDYGVDFNQIKYGQSDAPGYHLTKVNCQKISLINSTGDKMVEMDDAQYLHSLLQNVSNHYVIENHTFDHALYHLSKDCGELFNRPLLDIVNQVTSR